MDICTGGTFLTEKMIEQPITGQEYFLYPIPNTEFDDNARLKEQNPGF